MTDMGEIQSYLSVNITRDRANCTMEINQKDYIQQVVERFGMRDANPVYTPLPAGTEAHLVKYEDQASTSEIKKYQQIIGSLLYVQIGSRPDILFAVACLSQYASNPSQQHLRLAKYVLAYLNTTKDYVLCYAGGTSGEGLVGYADSSWGDVMIRTLRVMGLVTPQYVITSYRFRLFPLFPLVYYYPIPSYL